MKKINVKCSIMAFALLTLIFSAYPVLAMAEKSIVVIVGDCYMGNHAGSFDTEYKGKKISVDLTWGKTKLYRNSKEVKDVSSSFAPNTQTTGKSSMSGKQVNVKGLWFNKTSFTANKIFYK